MDDLRRLAEQRRERIEASPRWRDGRFHNTAPDTLPKPGLGTMAAFLFRRGRRTPSVPLPVVSPLETWRRAPDTGLRVTWLGHSTMLLEIDGHRVLTDPVFGARVSPMRHFGPRRFHPVPAALDALPDLDAVVLSHDHYDHLCASTMRALAASTVPVVTALGVGARLVALGFDPGRVTELDWGESVDLAGLRFTATPAQHFSGRGLRDRNRTLWASFVVAGATHRVFFSGDSGLTPEFADIGRVHGPFDLTMLEIGAHHPSWGSIHLGPANALEAFDMLGGGALLPVHWGTFNLALHDWDEPAETLLALAETRGARVLTPRLGQPLEPSHIAGPTAWWRGLDPVRAPAEAELRRADVENARPG